MSQEDYAILVGVSRYADAALHALKGPVHDVALMREWLVDPQGGAVPAENLTTIVSDEEAVIAPGAHFPPAVEDFLAAFRKIVFNADESAVVRRPAGRLYLFFSGHGFCERGDTSAQAALYVANSTRMLNWNICGTHYAKWARDQAVFGEIVLVMDCCRDAELYKEAYIVPLRRTADVVPAQTCKLFEVYAAPRGGKAQERPIAERDNAVHGLLTHALLKAIDHAAPGNACASTQDIKGYIHETWNALCGEHPADRPEIITPPNGEMSFGRERPKDFQQVFKLVKATDGAQLTIRFGANLQQRVQVQVLQSSALLTRDGQAITVPIAAGTLVIPLPTTYCLVTGVAGGALIEKAFQVGVGDVEL